MKPCISVILLAYHNEKNLVNCLNNIINQTLQEIEIILVNNTNFDNLEKNIVEYIKKDSRIRYIQYECDKGLIKIQKAVLKHALGEYILVIESNDILSLDACQKIYQQAQSCNADIVQFSLLSSQDDRNYFSSINFVKESLFGVEIFQSLFIENTNISFNIYGKCFKKSLFQKILAEIPEDPQILLSGDYLICFIGAYLAERYTFCQDAYYYSRMEISVFKRYTKIFGLESEKWISNYKNFFSIYYNFISQNNIKYEIIKNEESLLIYILSQFLYDMSYSDQKHYFSQLVNIVGIQKVMQLLFYHFNNLDLILPFFDKTRIINRKEIKNIAFYANHFTYGGSIRVFVRLVNEFTKLGYNVFIITYSDISNLPYQYSDKVTVISIRKEYRFIDLDKIVDQYCIDLLIAQEFESSSFYALLYAQLKEIHVIFILHTCANEYFFLKFWGMNIKYLIQNIRVMICLSLRDQLIFKYQMNFNAVYIPNPLTIDTNVIPASLDNHNIICVARIDHGKNYHFIISAFSLVLQKVPDAILTICGNGIGKLKDEMHTLAENLGVNNNIIWVGAVNNIGEYYQNASVHVFSSEFEGMPMVWGEAKAYGLPTVITRLDYLEMSYVGGSIIIDKDDVQGFADAIVELLKDKSYRQKIGQEAIESLEDFKTEKIMERWKQLFRDMEDNNLEDSDLFMVNPMLNKEEVLSMYQDELVLIMKNQAILSRNIHNQLNDTMGDINDTMSNINDAMRINPQLLKVIKKIFLFTIPRNSLQYKILRKIFNKMKVYFS